MPKLVAIAGPLIGGVFALVKEEGATFSIGRSVNNTLCVEDPSVSRNHCVLTCRGQQFNIADRGSSNRTYINGLPFQEHTLRSGDEIKIGESTVSPASKAAFRLISPKTVPPMEAGEVPGRR